MDQQSFLHKWEETIKQYGGTVEPGEIELPFAMPPEIKDQIIEEGLEKVGWIVTAQAIRLRPVPGEV